MANSEVKPLLDEYYGNETIVLTLSSGTGYDLGSTNVHTLTIIDDDAPLPPLSFTSVISNQSYTIGRPIADLLLSNATGGTAPYTYSLRPDAPAGLRFDASTQTLRGTPTESMASTTFTYTVTDADTSTETQTFTIEVTEPEAVKFVDSVKDQFYPVGISIFDVVLPEAMEGTAPYTYLLTPDVPRGLTFDAQTRTLSGTPSEVTAAKVFTYIVTDQAGAQNQITFAVEVYQISFTERIANQSYPRDELIAPLVLPEVTAGVSPIAYTLTVFDLPVGLRFDASSQTIGGTPTEVIPPVSLTYTATDANDARGSLTFTIEVVSPVHAEHDAGLPQGFRVYPNYPNPVQTTTYLVFDLPWPAQVQVDILDVTGRRVAVYPAASLSAGWGHQLELSDLDVPSGAYLYRIQAMSLEDALTSVYIGHLMRVM